MPKWKVQTGDRQGFAVEAATADEARAKAERKGHTVLGQPTLMAPAQDDSWMDPEPDEMRARVVAEPDRLLPRPTRTLYKVVEVAESALSNVFFGEGKVTAERLEKAINEQAGQGWRLVFQVERRQRRFGIFMRDVVLLTFERHRDG